MIYIYIYVYHNVHVLTVLNMSDCSFFVAQPFRYSNHIILVAHSAMFPAIFPTGFVEVLSNQRWMKVVVECSSNSSGILEQLEWKRLKYAFKRGYVGSQEGIFGPLGKCGLQMRGFEGLCHYFLRILYLVYNIIYPTYNFAT